MSNVSKLKKNVLVGFGGQIIVMIFGIIVPRIMMLNYGSDVNGMISTITQIFAYMALLEAGIGQASKNVLYQFLTKHDNEGVSKIVSIAQSYYRRITIIYGVVVIALSFVLPLVLKSVVDYWTIFGVVFFQGFGGVISFFFIENQTMVMVADGHSYIINIIETISKILSYIVRIILAMMLWNIAFVQFSYFIICVLKAVMYNVYFKKQYSWIKYRKVAKYEKLPYRNSFIIAEVAWTIFSSTDMIVLSIFVSTKLSSVYSVYSMVFVAINVLLNAIYMSTNYILGQTFYDDLNKYILLHDLFISVFLGTITIAMSTIYILIVPFVKLYTQGINDVNYVITSLPVMFCLVQLLSWSRYIQGNLTALAGYAKQTAKVSVIEAFLNLFLSIIFVRQFKIVGVLFATVIALPLKVIYTTYLSDIKILHRSCWNSIKILSINYTFFFGVVYVNQFIKLSITTYESFIFYLVIIFTLLSLVGILLNAITNVDGRSYFIGIIKTRWKREKNVFK